MYVVQSANGCQNSHQGMKVTLSVVRTVVSRGKSVRVGLVALQAGLSNETTHPLICKSPTRIRHISITFCGHGTQLISLDVAIEIYNRHRNLSLTKRDIDSLACLLASKVQPSLGVESGTSPITDGMNTATDLIWESGEQEVINYFYYSRGLLGAATSGGCSATHILAWDKSRPPDIPSASPRVARLMRTQTTNRQRF